MNILVARLMKGFFAPFSGAKLLFSSKKLFSLSMIPFLVGMAFVFLGFLLASRYLMPSMDSWIANLSFLQNSPILASITSATALLLGWVALSLVNFLLGYVFIIIVAGPFYALLAEEIFKRERGGKIKKAAITLMLRMFGLALIKIGIFAFIGIICFILAFVPVVNIFSTFTLFLLISFDCTDYSFEIDQLGLRQRFAFFHKHFWEYAGFSVSIICISFLPGAFFILLPAFVIGATKMYIQLCDKPV